MQGAGMYVVGWQCYKACLDLHDEPVSVRGARALRLQAGAAIRTASEPCKQLPCCLVAALSSSCPPKP